MDGGGSTRSSSCFFPVGPSRGRRRPQWRLPWFQGAKVAASDQDLADSAGKRRSAKAGVVARGLKVKVILSGLVDRAGKRFERSVPAVKFGHVAYIR